MRKFHHVNVVATSNLSKWECTSGLIISRNWHRGTLAAKHPHGIDENNGLDSGSAELRRVGVDAASLRRGGYTAMELFHGGYSEINLLSAGFTLAEVAAAGF